MATIEWMANARHAPPGEFFAPLRRDRSFATVEGGRHKRLLILQAPAGFGKTTFLSQWYSSVRDSGALAAWLSLESSDVSAEAFVANIALALVNADILSVEDLAFPYERHAATSALDALSGRIQAVQRETWLIIDDWHLVNDGDAPELLERLLRRLPANWHLALASRTPPQLPLATYRASGQLIEIGAEELSFSPEEATHLLGAGNCALDLCDPIIDLTMGWPIAVRLAALQPETIRRVDLGRSTMIMDAIDGMMEYLSSEVFTPLDEPIRQLLLEISILSSIKRDVVEFICEPSDTLAFMGALRTLNGLIIASQEDDELYLNPLLAAFLHDRRRDLAPERLERLHKRAADWFEQHGQLDHAVNHALACGDQTRSVRLVESANCLDMCILRGAPEVGSLLQRLPEDIVRKRPRLRAASAAMNLKRGSIAEARSLMSELRQSLSVNKDDRALERDIFILENLSLCFIDTSPSDEEISAYRQNLESSGGEEWWIDALRHNVYGRLEMRAGHLKEASAALERAFAVLEGGGSAQGCFFMMIHIAFCHLFLGELTMAEDALRNAQTILKRDLEGDFVYAAIACSMESLLYYERNELAEAGRLARLALIGLEQAEGCFEQYLVAVYVGASCAYALSGLEEALEILSRGRKLALFHGLHVMDRILTGMAAGFYSRSGQWRSDAVSRFVDVAGHDGSWLESDIATSVLSLVARCERRSDEARRLTATIIERARQGGRIATEIRAHLAMTLICAEDGDNAGAQEALSTSVALAAKESLVQPFFEADEQLLLHLRELSKNAANRMSPTASSFLSRLVLRMVATRKARDHGETLTAREREILAHLIDGVSRKEITSNKEIARALDLTENAVKFHLKNVFRKLDIENRDMAAAVARFLQPSISSELSPDRYGIWPTHH